VIGKSPARKVTAPKKPEREVIPLADDAYYALLSQIAGDRLEALWLIYLTVGARRGEAIAISRSGFRIVRRDDEEIGTLTMTRSLQRIRGRLKFVPAKTKKGNRTVELVPQLTEAIKRHLTRQKEERLKAGELWEEYDLLFCTRHGRALEPRNVTRRWHQLLAAAGITRTKLHAARHTVVSILLREGTDIHAVSAMAGHSRASFTVDTYGHLMSAPSVTATKMGEVLRRSEK
jgi:integrase